MTCIAAKQADFEEQAKLKNQFRALDDDEIDFLDTVASREQARQDAVRKETAEELEVFRKQQQAAEKAPPPEAATSSDVPAADTWKAKKRRRKDADIPVPKVRKTSDQKNTSPLPPAPKAASPPVRTAPAKPPTASALGLAYDSDDDD